jgi:hypothetical protein
MAANVGDHDEVFDTPMTRFVGRTARPKGLTGECGTISGVDTRVILADLGPGEPLPPELRQNVEGELDCAFDKVRLHHNPAADRIAEYFGAEAFAIQTHIVFRRDRFQPHSALGCELLRHELEHFLEPPGPLRAWFTRLKNSGGGLTYSIGPYRATPRVVGNSHYDLTEQALQQIRGFGHISWSSIRDWAEKINNYKKERFPQLGHDCPGLERFNEAQLHSHGGVPFINIGMSSRVTAAAMLTGTGVIGEILRTAIELVNRQRDQDVDRGFKLLGVALHTVQDYFSHYVPIHVRDSADLRTMCLDPPACRQKFINQPDWWKLEDDADVDGRVRFGFALERSKDLLVIFRRQMSRDIPNVVWKSP